MTSRPIADSPAGTLEVSHPATEPETPTRGRWTRRDSFACVACAAVALLLAIAPHLAALVKTGSAEYIAEIDDIFYITLARSAYYGEDRVRDPILGPREDAPDLHSWYQFVPSAWLARALGLPLVHLGLLWRVLGGVATGASLYFLFRRLLARTSSPTGWSLGCTLVCLADAGYCSGRSLVQDALLFPHLLRGTTPMVRPDAIGLYRIVTPLVNLPFLLLMVGLLVPTGRNRLRDALLAAVCLGLCVLLYFYYWTAAVVALGGYVATLVLSSAWQPAGRVANLAQAKLAGIVLVGGIAIGAPQVHQNRQTFSDPEIKPYLERAIRGTHVPPGHPLRRQFLGNAWFWGKLAIGTLGLLALRGPGMGLLWWLAVAGFALANSTIVTGLEFENFHWVLVYATMGQVLLLAILVGCLERWPAGSRRTWLRAAWAVPVALVIFAAVWRPYEAGRAGLSARLNAAVRGIRLLGPELAKLGPMRTLAGPRDAHVALLYSRCALLYQDPYTPMCFIPWEDVDRRHALNYWLRGFDYGSYAEDPKLGQTVTYFDLRPEWRPEVRARERLAIFRRLLDDPDLGRSLIARYGVSDLLLPADAPHPRRGGPWTLLARLGGWALWGRVLPTGG